MSKGRIRFQLVPREAHELTGEPGESLYVLVPVSRDKKRLKNLPASFPRELIASNGDTADVVLERKAAEAAAASGDGYSSGSKKNKKKNKKAPLLDDINWDGDEWDGDFDDADMIGMFEDDADYDYSQHYSKITGLGVYMDNAGNFTRPIIEEDKPAIPEDDPDWEIIKQNREKLKIAETRVGLSGLELPVVRPGKHAKITDDYLKALDGDTAGYDELEDDFFMKAMQSDEDMEEDIEETWVEDIRYEDEDYDGYYYEEDDGLEYKYDAEDEALRNEQFQAALREFEALDLEEANYEAEEKAKQNERAAPFVLSSQEIQQDVRRFRKHVTVDDVLTVPEQERELTKAMIRAQAERLAQEEAMSPEELQKQIKREFQRKPREMWDAESIVSTMSNTENLPTVIREQKRQPKKRTSSTSASDSSSSAAAAAGPAVLPAELPKKPTVIQDAIPEDDEEEDSELEYEVVVNEGQARRRDETAEEKKARKAAVKAKKAERRQQKKQLKRTFAVEAAKQTKVEMANRIHNPRATKL